MYLDMYPTKMYSDIYPKVPITPIPAVKPSPPDTYSGQFDLYTALVKGTLFKWLYDPYHEHKC